MVQKYEQSVETIYLEFAFDYRFTRIVVEFYHSTMILFYETTGSNKN